MTYNPEIHHRRSTRLWEWDYSLPWWYCVTICSYQCQCLLGNVVNDQMQLSNIGEIVREEWLKTPSVRPEIELDEFVIMPNHMHGIIIINETKTEPKSSVGTHGRASLQRQPRSIGSLIAGFKSIVTKRVNIMRNTPGEPVWQRRYHDHVIRNEADLHRIRTYLANNPLQWSIDEENPNNQT